MGRAGPAPAPRRSSPTRLTNRAYLRRRGIRQVIPERDDQLEKRRRRGHKGGRPPSFDVVAYRDRNVVERGINRFKYWRGPATRYDKTVCNYLGGLHLARILLWADDLAHSTDRT